MAINFFLKGRVIEDENIFVNKTDNEIRNLLNNFKRFESDEVPGVAVEVHFNGQLFNTFTDEEGYFELDAQLDEPILLAKTQWLKAEVVLPGLPSTQDDDIKTSAEIFVPDFRSSYGIITDVDDTILQTHMTSLFKLRMLQATFLQNVHSRMPMEGIVGLMKLLVKGKHGDSDHPVFYVSNSPWNIYDILEDFMALNDLPKGPIMLRDFGLPPLSRSIAYKGHKVETISHILRSFPNLQFIFLGDTASRDADIYMELALNFPKQVSSIYIRHTRDTPNARRIKQLFNNSKDIDVHLVRSSADINQDAIKKGYIKV